MLLDFLADTIIVTGHYGTGKTNLSVNLAYALRDRGEPVTVADLDIVNPYFRTADFKQSMGDQGIGFIASAFAGSSLDIPSLSPALDARIGGKGRLIVDVGGDDAGAYALGRYAARVAEKPYTMLYVINAFRYLTREPEESAAMLREIEAASRLKATHIVNNSNLSTVTTPGDIESSGAYARSVSAITGVPLAFTAVRRDVYDQLTDKQGYYPVDIYVKAPWSEGA
jgi:hypothetical protein